MEEGMLLTEIFTKHRCTLETKFCKRTKDNTRGTIKSCTSYIRNELQIILDSLHILLNGLVKQRRCVRNVSKTTGLDNYRDQVQCAKNITLLVLIDRG